MNIKSEEQNELLQRKLDDIGKLSTQSNVNLQNEVIKKAIFKN
jgi:hypothetical protein